MVEIRKITRESKADLNLPNEPFEMPGKFIPSLQDGVWSYRVEPYAKPESMVFPDEHYDFEELSKNSVMLGAYDGGACVGLAICQEAFFRYLYLYDLKVNAAARGKGAGKALIRAALETARERDYRGVYTLAQDNNVNACRFYLQCGFRIGGFDNRVYSGTSQEGKGDIIFYLDGEETI